MKKIFFFLLACGVWVNAQTVNEKILLRIKPEKGDEQKMKVNINMEGNGFDMQMLSDFTINVQEVTDTSSVLDYVYERIKMDMDIGGIAVNYDSNDKNQSGMNAMIHEQMKPIYGKSMILEIGELGNIIKTELDPEIATILQGQQPDISSSTIPLPEDPVSVGDFWVRSVEKQSMILQMKMTITKITPSEILVDMTGKILDTEENEIGDATGNYILDRKRGLITKFAEMDMNMIAGGENMKMKMKCEVF